MFATLPLWLRVVLWTLGVVYAVGALLTFGLGLWNLDAHPEDAEREARRMLGNFASLVTRPMLVAGVVLAAVGWPVVAFLAWRDSE